MTEHISTPDFRKRLGDILDRVHLRHDRFVIERKGTAVAAVVPVQTLAAMERLSREFLLDVLERRVGGDATPGEAEALANETKHRTRAKRRR